MILRILGGRGRDTPCLLFPKWNSATFPTLSYHFRCTILSRQARYPDIPLNFKLSLREADHQSGAG